MASGGGRGAPSISLAEQGREVHQVAAPHHPGVHAGSLNWGQMDVLALQPSDQMAIGGDEPVLCAAGDPQQMQLLIRARTQLRERGCQILAEAAGAESSY